MSRPQPARRAQSGPARVAFLCTRGVDETSLLRSWRATEANGSRPVLLSDEPGTVDSLVDDWYPGESFVVHQRVSEADPADFEALVLPGGLLSAGHLRTNQDAQAFVGDFVLSGRLVATLGEAVWVLIEAGVAQGRSIACPLRVRTDLLNAGGLWIDAPTHRDSNLISGRDVADLARFEASLVRILGRSPDPQGLQRRSRSSRNAVEATPIRVAGNRTEPGRPRQWPPTLLRG